MSKIRLTKNRAGFVLVLGIVVAVFGLLTIIAFVQAKQNRINNSIQVSEIIGGPIEYTNDEQSPNPEDDCSIADLSTEEQKFLGIVKHALDEEQSILLAKKICDGKFNLYFVDSACEPGLKFCRTVADETTCGPNVILFVAYEQLDIDPEYPEFPIFQLELCHELVRYRNCKQWVDGNAVPKFYRPEFQFDKQDVRPVLNQEEVKLLYWESFLAFAAEHRFGKMIGAYRDEKLHQAFEKNMDEFYVAVGEHLCRLYPEYQTIFRELELKPPWNEPAEDPENELVLPRIPTTNSPNEMPLLV